METIFKGLNMDTYLQVKREENKEQEKARGLSFVNQRQEVIQNFVDKINSDRAGSAYPQVKWTHINGQLRNYRNMHDLEFFYKQCNEAKCFSSLFWWKLKEQRTTVGN